MMYSAYRRPRVRGALPHVVALALATILVLRWLHQRSRSLSFGDNSVRFHPVVWAGWGLCLCLITRITNRCFTGTVAAMPAARLLAAAAALVTLDSRRWEHLCGTTRTFKSAGLLLARRSARYAGTGYIWPRQLCRRDTCWVGTTNGLANNGSDCLPQCWWKLCVWDPPCADVARRCCRRRPPLCRSCQHYRQAGGHYARAVEPHSPGRPRGRER